MPRYPTVYLWGALAGIALWLAHAPAPFPLLAGVLVVCGSVGAALSLTYLYLFERWEWRVKAAAIRRLARALTGGSRRTRLRTREARRRPPDAPAPLNWEMDAMEMPPAGGALGVWTIAP